MKDIPFFPTDYGVASLSLGEIPYRQTAYIRIQEVFGNDLQALIQECAAFCRAAGADHVYWNAPDVDLEPHCIIYQMSGTAWVDTAKLENLFPVTAETVSQWRQIFNNKMSSVDHTSTLSSFDEKRILASPGAYFVHHNGTLLGIGWIDDTKLLAIASVVPGAGERIAHSLMSLIEGAPMTLEVASSNHRAIALYKKLGFMITGEIIRWYQV